MAEDVPLIPMTVQGVALIDGSPAPVDTVIAAYFDGEYVEQFLVNTPSGDFVFYISGKAGDEGKPVTFTINGKDTGESFDWGPGKMVSSVELSVGNAADSGSSKKSSTSNSGSGSLTGSGEPEDNIEIIESAVTQPEVVVQEETVEENTDDEVGEEKSPEPSGDSSKTSSAPGFQIIYAVAGVILLTFGPKLVRESRRKP
ncbi:MAG TPA: hypothetical protein HA306_08840 [Methanosarcina sp.]|nr:hypothetical protein [Methanosarcina sp.]